MADADLVEGVRDLIGQLGYPCLGARSVFNQGRVTFRVYSQLTAEGVAGRLLADLAQFARSTDVEAGFASFIAVFHGPLPQSEVEFERLLWRQLQQLHDTDEEPWNRAVSDDPTEPHFAFSVAGTAFFVVGLHSQASRVARRAPNPTLVFNLHEQFDRLRASGGYPRMRDTIRRRDQELQGTINPMVADHGTVSEARQYSGRHVAEDWRAPLILGEADGS